MLKIVQLIKESLIYTYNHHRLIMINFFILDSILMVMGLVLNYFSLCVSTERQEEVFSTAFSLISLWVTAPFMISVYKSIVNDEALAPSAWRNFKEKHVWRFVKVSTFLWAALKFGEDTLYSFLSLAASSSEVASFSLLSIIFLVASVIAVYLYFTCCCAYIEIGVAVDGHKSLKAIYHSSKGKVWDIIKAGSLTTLPTLVLVGLLSIGLGKICSVGQASSENVVGLNIQTLVAIFSRVISDNFLFLSSLWLPFLYKTYERGFRIQI